MNFKVHPIVQVSVFGVIMLSVGIFNLVSKASASTPAIIAETGSYQVTQPTSVQYFTAFNGEQFEKEMSEVTTVGNFGNFSLLVKNVRQNKYYLKQFSTLTSLQKYIKRSQDAGYQGEALFGVSGLDSGAVKSLIR